MSTSRKAVKARIKSLKAATKALTMDFFRKCIPEAYKVTHATDVVAGFAYIANHEEYLKTAKWTRYWYVNVLNRPYQLTGNLIHFWKLSNELDEALMELRIIKKSHAKAIQFTDDEMSAYCDNYLQSIYEVTSKLTALINYINESIIIRENPEYKEFTLRTKAPLTSENNKDANGFYNLSYLVFELDKDFANHCTLGSMIFNHLYKSNTIQINNLIEDYSNEENKKFAEIRERMITQRRYHQRSLEILKKRADEQQQEIASTAEKNKTQSTQLQLIDNKLQASLAKVSFLSNQIAAAENKQVDTELNDLMQEVEQSSNRCK